MTIQPWTSTEIRFVTDLYRQGGDLAYICEEHNRMFPLRSFNAVKMGIYNNIGFRRKHVFSREENEWLRGHADLAPRKAYFLFRRQFGEINYESLRTRVYRIRRAGKEATA